MSTPLDAVYNRCRPAPPSNGLSSALLVPTATTRCSRDCSRKLSGSGFIGQSKRVAGRAFLCIVASAAILAPVAGNSQQPTSTPTTPLPRTTTSPAVTPPAEPQAPTHPEVVNLTLKGVKAVKAADLQQSISTTASHCNGFILVPFCWITNSKYV